MNLSEEQMLKLDRFLQHCVDTMWRDSDNLEIGEDISDISGVKIIFDGYGYNEETDENDDTNHESYAIFIHRTSHEQPFPEHDQIPWALIHRPREEACFYAWYDALNDSWEFVNTYDVDSEMGEDVLMTVVDSLIEQHLS